MNLESQTAKIRSIACLAELSGYEAQAKKRGLHPEEVRAIAGMRLKLTPKKRGK